MIIGTCGYGSTGSSAVSDYLKEFDEIQVLDGVEFEWVTGVDGLIDLDYHIHNSHFRTRDSECAIYRYKQRYNYLSLHYCHSSKMTKDDFNRSVNCFLDSIVQIKWNGLIKCKYGGLLRALLDNVAIKSIIKIEKIIGRQTKLWPYSELNFSLSPENFDEAAKKHVKELIISMGGDLNKNIVLDQPFSGNNPQIAFKYFDDPYAIVVDRDPRDLYVFGKTRLLGRNHFMPMDSVEDFVKYYRLIRAHQSIEKSQERVLFLKFEDLVYHYNKTTKLIRDFLHLSENPRPKSVFDPSLSMANTQVWKRFPQFDSDIKYIEKELGAFLFDFNNCEEPDKNSKMFFGKSPKNS